MTRWCSAGWPRRPAASDSPRGRADRLERARLARGLTIPSTRCPSSSLSGIACAHHRALSGGRSTPTLIPMTTSATASLRAWHEHLMRYREQLLAVAEELDDDHQQGAIAALHEAERHVRNATRSINRAIKSLPWPPPTHPLGAVTGVFGGSGTQRRGMGAVTGACATSGTQGLAVDGRKTTTDGPERPSVGRRRAADPSASLLDSGGGNLVGSDIVAEDVAVHKSPGWSTVTCSTTDRHYGARNDHTGGDEPRTPCGREGSTGARSHPIANRATAHPGHARPSPDRPLP